MKNQRLKVFLITFSKFNRKLYILTKGTSYKKHIVTFFSGFRPQKFHFHI